MADSQEKTEQATDKRMKEVRSKGQLSRSQDLTAWLGIGAAALMLPITIERAAEAATDQLFSVRDIVVRTRTPASRGGAGRRARVHRRIIGPLLIVVVVAVLAGAAAQGGVHLKKFKPNSSSSTWSTASSGCSARRRCGRA